MGEAPFARECARVAVLGMVQQLGFSAVQGTAADTLTNILHKCTPTPTQSVGGQPDATRHPDIEEVGHRAHLYAELAGRVEANLNDVRLTFEEMGLQLRDLVHYAASLDEVPFPKGAPSLSLSLTHTHIHTAPTTSQALSFLGCLLGGGVGWVGGGGGDSHG